MELILADVTGSWQRVEIELPSSVLHSESRLAIRSITDSPFDDWYVDAVSLMANSDGDADGVLDECARYGDFDGNGLVDLPDAALILGCLTGPAAPTSEACRPYDLSGDAFVDLRDAALLMTRFTGSPR